MSYVVVEGQLRPRFQKAEEVAACLARSLQGLAELDPIFSGWIRAGARHRSVVPKVVTLPPDEAELRSWIAENPIFKSQEGRKQHIGYDIRALTPEGNPIRADFWLHLDSRRSGPWLVNRTGITLFTQGDASPFEYGGKLESLISFLRRVLLITATAWDCDWAGVSPGDFRQEAERPPNGPFARYMSGWMIYLEPSLAARLGEPENFDIERLPTGGILFTTASDAVFNTWNPAHRAAAQRFQTALAPLNDRPNAQLRD